MLASEKGTTSVLHGFPAINLSFGEFVPSKIGTSFSLVTPCRSSLLSLALAAIPLTEAVIYLTIKPRASKMRQLFSTLALLYLISLSSAQQCYSQTGSPLGPTYQPCNSSSSMFPGACCNIGGGDICTEFGLCLRQGWLPGFFYQDGCTDPMDDKKTCPQFCPSSK